MLKALELRNFAIIDSVRVEFNPGLNVLTGETGAGKSILVDALALLIGGRADSGMIRAGEGDALIQGFFGGEGVGIETAARRLAKEGRSTARLDGEVVTVGELQSAGANLIAIHGQHAFQTLMDAHQQRRLLDRLLPADARAALEAYEGAFREYTRTTRQIAELRGAERERARRLDILRFQRDEIDAAKLKPGDEEAIEAELASLRNAERITHAAGRAVAALGEDEPSATGLLAVAQRELETAGRYHPSLEALAAELDESLTALQATLAEVVSFLDGFEGDPARLDELEARLATIETLRRKYGDSVPAVLAYRAEIAVELETLESATENLASFSTRLAELERELERLAATLTTARRAVGATLSADVSEALRPLGMAHARFEVALEDLREFGPHGRDRISFAFSGNLGEPLAPLSSVASGGELSRVMLALNVVTGSDCPTLVFDEVDAGIGGSTARAVGELLARLARDHQVLVVTHLPQVAAYADQQFFVRKEESNGRTATRVVRLEPHEREAELARMLSGAVTDAALAHARELLQGSQAGD
jgi:DNA repair protein RecN (Recombination protein N)